MEQRKDTVRFGLPRFNWERTWRFRTSPRRRLGLVGDEVRIRASRVTDKSREDKEFRLTEFRPAPCHVVQAATPVKRLLDHQRIPLHASFTTLFKTSFLAASCSSCPHCPPLRTPATDPISHLPTPAMSTSARRRLMRDFKVSTSATRPLYIGRPYPRHVPCTSIDFGSSVCKQILPPVSLPLLLPTTS